MKIWMLLACLGCLLADATVFAANVTVDDDDDEYEEIIVRRKKKKKKSPADTLAAVAAPDVTKEGAPAAKADDEPPPPPEPPEADAAEPRRLVRYFCKAWKDEEWERLWWAMTPKYRKEVSFETFKTRFTDDAEQNGGLKDENIVDVSKTNSGVAVKVELLFKFQNAKTRVVKAVVERIVGGQYRMTDSAILPVDLNDL